MTTVEARKLIEENPLDPERWMQVGKARRWKAHILYRLSESDYEKKIFPKEGPEWKANALRYFETVLSGGDLTKFWESLS